MPIQTENELGEALKVDPDSIEIEGNLAARVVRIKATGKIARVVAIGAIGAIAVALTVTAGTGGAAAPASGLVGVGAVSVLGFSTAASAIAIALAGGGIGALSKLRTYKIVSRSSGRVVLRRR